MADRNHPFGLTSRQAQIMDALAEKGAIKLVARELDVSTKTIDNSLADIRERMGAITTMQAAVRWDRVRRAA